ncbi:MAG TPA: hydrogenase expression protein HypE, partial [Actinophytocola sp.]|nr:hydrogenase expression protein HypE [Actinophytocola sp.]
GCWGPVVKCNVPKRGWINGVGGCPNVGGICIACTMPGFPDKFMPFMDPPPGSRVSAAGSKVYGGVIRRLRKITERKADREPAWRKKGRELTTGYKASW